MERLGILTLGLLTAGLSAAPDAPRPAARTPPLVRSAKGGPWSAADTWEGGTVPAAGARVQVRTGHAVTYDVKSGEAIRSIHVAGTLTFARDRDTLLTVGLVKIQAGDDAGEDGFDCEAHVRPPDPDRPRPALEVGTPNDPVPAGRTAVIRLAPVAGLDPESCPAIVCCGGRLDLHGAPLARTWVKLGADAAAGDTQVRLAEPVAGWRVGDRVIVTGTSRVPITNDREDAPPVSLRDGGRIQTEERFVRAIDGVTLTLDRPLLHGHRGGGDFRGEVANLTRNVVVESADPGGARGHTMYHRHSAGAVSYAEFRHLGKKGVLGRYSLHYHLCGDTMRGSYVLGASIWDSHNRWLTIHGTDYLVVRDCVGYRSVGHGFFLEDGTEVGNVLDRNLAVLAFNGKPLPRQVLPYDANDGAGFWWANSRNTFTRNVACECDTYGYFFQSPRAADFNPVLPVRQPDGTTKKVDVRTLPFVRFEDNESHTQQFHGFSLGGGNRVDLKARGAALGDVGGVGPDARHPFVVRNLRVWDCLWAVHLRSPSVLMDRVTLHDARYGFFMSVYDGHAYRGVKHSDVLAAGAGKLFLPHASKDYGPNKLPNVEADFPRPLDPVDDLPPLTVITHVRREGGKVVVRGTSSDDGVIERVSVNGRAARRLAANLAEWEVTLDPPADGRLTARAVDRAGNEEPRPHVVVVGVDGPRTVTRP